MRHFIFASLLAMLALGVATSSAAQTMGHDHGSMMQSKPAASAAKTTHAEGEVRKIDKTRGTVVLKHGPLEALGMPPMTMEFVAKDPKLLANLKQGDKVRFTPEQGKDGALVVGAIEAVKN